MGATVLHTLTDEQMQRIDRALDVVARIDAERIHGRYMTTAEAAIYIRRSKDYVVRVLAKEIPHQDGNPLVFDIRDIDQWVENKKINR